MLALNKNLQIVSGYINWSCAYVLKFVTNFVALLFMEVEHERSTFSKKYVLYPVDIHFGVQNKQNKLYLKKKKFQYENEKIISNRID